MFQNNKNLTIVKGKKKEILRELFLLLNIFAAISWPLISK